MSYVYVRMYKHDAYVCLPIFCFIRSFHLLQRDVRDLVQENNRLKEERLSLQRRVDGIVNISYTER